MPATADDAGRRDGVRSFSGWLVLVLLLASAALWAAIAFGTLPHLQSLAGGLAPFDVRPRGYSYAEARAFLQAAGPPGRAYYLDPELVFDSFFPPLYALSLALAMWWLTKPGRLCAGATPSVWRWTLVALPLVLAVIDGGVENVCIAKMLWQWPDLSPDLVRLASLATQLKSLLLALTAVAIVALAVAAAWRRQIRRRSSTGAR